MTFERILGIDYSGAETPEARLKGLRVYAATCGELPEEISSPSACQGVARHWSRRELAHWLCDQLSGPSLRRWYMSQRMPGLPTTPRRAMQRP